MPTGLFHSTYKIPTRYKSRLLLGPLALFSPLLSWIPYHVCSWGSGQSAPQHHDSMDLLALGATGQAQGVPVARLAAMKLVHAAWQDQRLRARGGVGSGMGGFPS